MRLHLSAWICYVLLATFASITTGYSQSTGGSTTSTRENWLPSKGNVGIGTRSPSTDLEVIGNVNVTSGITTQTFESNSVQSTTFKLLSDGIINGSLGIGVLTPSEKLDILGNMKLSGNLTANGITIQSLNSNSGVLNTLTVNQNSRFNGKVGIGIDPAEKLHVLGNVRIENDLFSNKFTTTFIQTTQLNSGLSTFSENATFNKDAFILGKLGLGTSSAPSEVLDVNGNIKSNAGLFSSSLNTGTAQINSLNVLQNSIFNGLVGIGVTTAEEKLHVGGNLKVSEGIFSTTITTTSFQTNLLNATGNATFAEKTIFSKDVILNGKLGIGVTSPSESLDVNGNIKATQIAADGLSIQQGSFNTLSVAQNSIFNGKVGIGVGQPTESLDVTGNIKSTGSINASSLTANQGTFSQGFTAGNSSVNGNLNVTGQLTAQSLSLADINATGNVTTGGNLSVTGSTTVNGLTAGNSSVNGTLNVTGLVTTQSISLTDANASGNVNTAGNLIVNGNTTVSGFTAGNSSVNGTLDVTGQLNAKSLSLTDINASGDLSVSGKTNVKALGVEGDLAGQSASFTNITSSGNALVNQTLTVNGVAELKNDLSVTGSSMIGGNLNVTGTLNAGSLSISDINTTGSATVSQNLSVTGAGQVGGDLNIGGNLKAGVIEATEFKKSDGSSLFNFDNTSISQTLSVAAANVPSNYKLAVGGNIIATGIDIKIPQKWPDYVFTEEHAILPIREVKEFIEQNGHLPGVSSAAEMEQKKNYSVSEMDAKLLEKIEELTLYIIKQSEEIDSLKKDMQRMKKQSAKRSK